MHHPFCRRQFNLDHDCSHKPRPNIGKHTSSHCIYGYKKAPNDKDRWIIDEDAALIPKV